MREQTRFWVNVGGVCACELGGWVEGEVRGSCVFLLAFRPLRDGANASYCQALKNDFFFVCSFGRFIVCSFGRFIVFFSLTVVSAA